MLYEVITVCASAFSTATTVTVDPAVVAGTVSGGTTNICLGSPTGTMTLSGHTGNVVKWQKRVDGGAWVDIASTLTTYSEIPSSVGVVITSYSIHYTKLYDYQMAGKYRWRNNLDRYSQYRSNLFRNTCSCRHLCVPCRITEWHLFNSILNNL